MTVTAAILEEAIGWHLRQAELSAQDWHGFVAWLEASPANAAAYDQVALADGIAADLPQLKVANDEPVLTPTSSGARGRWWWGVGGTAIAAGIAALVMPLAMTSTAQTYAVATHAGEHRTVTLDDGTKIELGGDTAMRFERGNPRIAMLDKGEATFTVRHDAARPFALKSGALTVQDVGTVFDVTRAGARLDVAVAEGAVMFQPDGDRITVTAGNALSAREDSGSVALSKVAPETVGGWRNGQLSFQGEPLSVVAAAIQRANGAKLTLTQGLSAKPFTGMVRLTGVAEQDVPHFAALIGASWRRDGEQWVLSPTGDTTR